MTLMPFSSTDSATNANVSGITEFCVPANQPAPATSIHTPTSRRTNLLHPSRGIALIDVLTCFFEATVSSRKIPLIGEPRFAHVIMTQDQSEHQTAPSEQYSNAQLYRWDIKRVGFVKDCCVRTLFPINRVFFNFLSLFLVITSFSQSAGKFALMIFLHANYL